MEATMQGWNDDTIGKRIVVDWLITLPVTQYPPSARLLELAQSIDACLERYELAVTLIEGVISLIDSLHIYPPNQREHIFYNQTLTIWKPSAMRFLARLAGEV